MLGVPSAGSPPAAPQQLRASTGTHPRVTHSLCQPPFSIQFQPGLAALHSLPSLGSPFNSEAFHDFSFSLQQVPANSSVTPSPNHSCYLLNKPPNELPQSCPQTVPKAASPGASRTLLLARRQHRRHAKPHCLPGLLNREQIGQEHRPGDKPAGHGQQGRPSGTHCHGPFGNKSEGREGACVLSRSLMQAPS